jgi:YD repeat-containing protein
LISYPTTGGKFNFDVSYANKAYYNGPLGNNWDFHFNQFLREDTTGNMVYHNGNLGAITFVKNAGGTYDKNMGIRATLVKSVSGTYTLTYDSGEVSTFSFTRKITTEKDRFGNTTSLVYDSDDKLVTITDSNNRVYTLTYYTHRRIKDITDFAGYKVVFTYFGAGSTLGNEFDLQKI